MSLTLADIDAMPAADYRRKLEDPAFVAEVNALLNPMAPLPPLDAPPAPEGEDDPSMPAAPPRPTSVRDRVEQPVTLEPAALVVPAQPAASVELPELVYEYQPLDELNRPIGGKQVIKYKTPDELTKKLTEQNILILRQLRKVTREKLLGPSTQDVIPNDAARFEITEFKPKELTAEERFQLTQDLNDPEKFASARDRLLESAVGVSPQKLRETLSDQQMTILQLRAKENFLSFADSNPFLTGSQPTDLENTKVLTDWMFKHELAPTVENYQLAHAHLRSAGLLNEAPVVPQVPAQPAAQPAAVLPVEPAVPKAQEPVTPPARISEAEPQQPKRHSQVPSGLNDRVSSASGVSPTYAMASLNLADIDKMSADDYKKALKDPAFRKLVDRLEKEAADRRRQRSV